MLPTRVRQHTLAVRTRGEIRLLYVAPERFASAISSDAREPACRAVRGRRSARRIGVRPRLQTRISSPERRRRTVLPQRTPAGTSAHRCLSTATPEVRDDIVDLLGLSDREWLSLDSPPNIELRVCSVGGDLEKKQLLPADYRSSVGRWCTRRHEKAEAAAATLQDSGVEAAAYHAAFPIRAQPVQDRSRRAPERLCATNVFGMGIDRPDVESVVHVDIPGSLEAYTRRLAGPAGMAGRRSRLLGTMRTSARATS